VGDTLTLFHHQRGPARRAYARFVADGIGAPDPAENVPRAGFIGGEAFVDQVSELVEVKGLSPEIPRKARPAPSLGAIEERSGSRNEAIQAAYDTRAFSLTEIARHFGVHLSTASRIARGPDARSKTR